MADNQYSCTQNSALVGALRKAGTPAALAVAADANKTAFVNKILNEARDYYKNEDVKKLIKTTSFVGANFSATVGLAKYGGDPKKTLIALGLTFVAKTSAVSTLASDADKVECWAAIANLGVSGAGFVLSAPTGPVAWLLFSASIASSLYQASNSCGKAY